MIGDVVTIFYSNGKEIGTCCADAGLIGVFPLVDILNYNPKFEEYLLKSWCVARINNSIGTAQIKILFDEEAYAFCYNVLGHGNIDFSGSYSGF